MFKPIANSRALWQGVALACVIAGSAAATSSAFAGECPADKMKANAREKVDFKPVGVTDVTLGSINLEKQPAKIRDRELRFRKLTIEPGGIVPWHSHDHRPALIYVQQGEIVEYASNCAEPILHKAGDIRPEVFGTSHWSEESGHPDRHSVCRRCPQGSARPQYVTGAPCGWSAILFRNPVPSFPDHALALVAGCDVL
jgi:quercetin dioxygenase-like cupin family protein